MRSGGAYVVAPQSPSFWIEDGRRFAPQIREIVGDLVRRYPIDRERIYVAGCSNGGYMTMELTSVYRDLLAAALPICGVVESLEPGGPPLLTDTQLEEIYTRPGSSSDALSFRAFGATCPEHSPSPRRSRLTRSPRSARGR